MGEIPEGRKPLLWKDMPFAERPVGHPSTERLEIEKLQERVAELEQTVDGIWRYAVDETVSDHHFRGWAEVEARAVLGDERAASLEALREMAWPAAADAPEQDMPEGFWDGAEMRPAEDKS